MIYRRTPQPPDKPEHDGRERMVARVVLIVVGGVVALALGTFLLTALIALPAVWPLIIWLVAWLVARRSRVTARISLPAWVTRQAQTVKRHRFYAIWGACVVLAGAAIIVVARTVQHAPAGGTVELIVTALPWAVMGGWLAALGADLLARTGPAATPADEPEPQPSTSRDVEPWDGGAW